MKINETRNARALALALSIGVGLLYQNTAAQAQSAMAPPVSGGAPAAGQNVYQWADVPLNQQIPVTRAVFDQGGYQLYASTGETIVVPFVNQNLYAMKFGQSSSGGMYFINDGTAPTLFVPPGGYLENAAASGAHWYPFPQHFNYVSPVYIGIAPTWSEYTSMGWYPGMAYYGGYWGYHPWHVGLAFSPFPGLFFSIGGHPYYGWNSYHSYYFGHPYGRIYERSFAPYHYYGIPHRGPAYFAGRAAFGHPSGYYASHGSFARGGGAFGRATIVHNTTIVHNSFGHNSYNNSVHNSFGHSSGAFGHASGSFSRSAAPGGHAFGGATAHNPGAFGHSGGSFGHSPSGFGGSRAAAPAFGHSAPGSGGFSHAGSSGGGSHGSFGGGGGSHGSFGGGGGGSHGGGGGDHHK